MEIRPVLQAAPLAVTSGVRGAQLTDGQVVTGKVLSVNAKGAQLSVDGHVLTVQSEIPLAPGDQLALQVSLAGSGQVRLTMLSLQGSAVSLLSDPNIAALLEQVDLPADPPHRDAARTLLQEAGTVDRPAMRELMRQTPADRPAAAYLLARGLPVTPVSLKLASSRDPSSTFGQQLAGPLSEALGQPDSPPELLALVLPAGAEPGALTEALAGLAEAFTPPEARLGRHLRRTPASAGPPPSKALDAPGTQRAQTTQQAAAEAPDVPSEKPPAAVLGHVAGSPDTGLQPKAGSEAPGSALTATDPLPGAVPAASESPEFAPNGPPAAESAVAAESAALLGSPGRASVAPGSENPPAKPPSPPARPSALQAAVSRPSSPAPTQTDAASARPPADGPPIELPSGPPGGDSPLPSELVRDLASNLVVALAKAISRQAAAKGIRPTEAPPPGGAAPPPSASSSSSPLNALQRQIQFQQLADSALQENPAAGQEVRLPLIFGAGRGELVVQRWKGNSRDSEGHSRVVVALDMPKLGPIKVDVMYSRRHLNGHMTVADPRIADFLRGRIAELSHGLAGVGVGVGHLSVSTPQEGPATAPTGARFDLRL